MQTVPSDGNEKLMLIVNGTKLHVNRSLLQRDTTTERRKRYPLKHIHVEGTSVENRGDEEDKEGSEEEESRGFRIQRRAAKEVFRLNTATFAVKDVQHDRLRAIRETQQLQDLTRLLNTHLGNARLPDRNQQPSQARKRQNDQRITSVDPDAIYTEFFQNHYDAIRHAVEVRQQEQEEQTLDHDNRDSSEDDETE